MSASEPVSMTPYFLEIGQSNVAPKSYADTLQPGRTKRYDDPVEALFGETTTSGTVHILATGEVAAASRTFDMESGESERDSRCHFFPGIPAHFAMGRGETTLVQGVSSEGSSGAFRSSFGMVETTGQAVTVRIMF
jgi:hypothetical protein